MKRNKLIALTILILIVFLLVFIYSYQNSYKFTAYTIENPKYFSFDKSNLSMVLQKEGLDYSDFLYNEQNENVNIYGFSSPDIASKFLCNPMLERYIVEEDGDRCDISLTEDGFSLNILDYELLDDSVSAVDHIYKFRLNQDNYYIVEELNSRQICSRGLFQGIWTTNSCV